MENRQMRASFTFWTIKNENSKKKFSPIFWVQKHFFCVCLWVISTVLPVWGEIVLKMMENRQMRTSFNSWMLKNENSKKKIFFIFWVQKGFWYPNKRPPPYENDQIFCERGGLLFGNFGYILPATGRAIFGLKKISGPGRDEKKSSGRARPG